MKSSSWSYDQRFTGLETSLSMRFDRRFLGRLGIYDVRDQASDEIAQIETLVESISKGDLVVLGVLAVIQALDGTGQSGLAA